MSKRKLKNRVAYVADGEDPSAVSQDAAGSPAPLHWWEDEEQPDCLRDSSEA